MVNRASHSANTPPPAAVVVAALFDAVCVVAFAALGRTEHGGRITLPELWQAAWPFLLAAAIVWVLLRAWQKPTRIWPTGLLLSFGTVAIGMVLRVTLTAGGAALPFVLVATGVLSLAFIGWRSIWFAGSRIFVKAAER